MGKQYTVTGMELTNSSGSAVVDANGVVSTTNFISSQGSSVATGTLTSTSFVEVPNGSTGASISLIRSTKVMINTMINCYHLDSDGIVIAQVFDGTSAIGPQMIAHGFGPDTGGDTPITTYMSYIQELASGTRDLHLKVRQNNSPGTAFFNVGGGNVVSLLNYVILGN